MTFDGADDRQPAWSPDGRIVFSSKRAGAYRLFVMKADGTDVRQLTFTGGTMDFEADWSPDGGRIVFDTDRCCSVSDIWIMNVADGSMRRLAGPTPEGSFGPKWAPDGTKISFSFVRSDFSRMFAWTSAGSPNPIAGIDGVLAGDGGAFSPDGTTFTYTLGSGIYVNGSPAPLARGSELDWGVRAEPERCAVPRLRGRTLGTARRLLQRSHCRLGRVTRAYSKSIRRDRIIGESPHAGAVRNAEAPVAVVVSRGRR